MSSQAKLSLWKKFSLNTKKLDASDSHIDKIKKASSHSVTFSKSFEEISKNEGISYLILDPTEMHIQIMHHGHVLGGNWSAPIKKLIAVLGTDKESKPVQIIRKSIRNIKEKSHSFDDFLANIDKEDDFSNLDRPDVTSISRTYYRFQTHWQGFSLD